MYNVINKQPQRRKIVWNELDFARQKRDKGRSKVIKLKQRKKKFKNFFFSDILKHSVAYCCRVCGGRGIKNTSIYLIALHSF